MSFAISKGDDYMCGFIVTKDDEIILEIDLRYFETTIIPKIYRLLKASNKINFMGDLKVIKGKIEKISLEIK